MATAMATVTVTVTVKNKVKNKAFEILLTDLHTHILPGIDDGAADLEKALQMLRAQKANGVERVALTPHFYPLREEVEEFLEKRQGTYAQLMSNWDAETMPQLRLGAEVHYSPGLTEMDLRSLTLDKTDYLLLELSDTVMPAFIEQVFQCAQDQGITPVLAHVERCVYFAERPERLLRLIEMGALAQISLRMLPTRRIRNFAEVCLQNNVAQIIASDIHALGEGKSTLGELVEGLSEETVKQAEAFARAVWDNTQLPAFEPIPIRKKLFGYA